MCSRSMFHPICRSIKTRFSIGMCVVLSFQVIEFLLCLLIVFFTMICEPGFINLSLLENEL